MTCQLCFERESVRGEYWCVVCADREPPSDVLEQASREPGGESDGEREIRLLTERGGRVGGTW